MSANLTGSALGLGAGLAGLVREDRLAIEGEGAYGHLQASYSFGEALPWSPTLTSGYGFVSGKPDDAAATESGSLPVAHMQFEYISGNSVAEISLSTQPIERLKLETAYKTLVCDRRAQGVGLAAEWQPSQRLSLRMLGELSHTGTQNAAPSSSTGSEARLIATLKLGF
ncbi:MAG: hypothetical protein L0210_13980 [Rhodospirillales bacterium]|nr:hypothetical protein [Rhodospirillales bacterium]